MDCADASTHEEKLSAWKENVKRPIFDDLKQSIKKGTVSDIYVWDLDRIHRNYKRLKEFFEFCKIHDCKVHSFRQPFLNEIYTIPEPFGEIIQDLMIKIFSWIGQNESDKKSDRVKMAVRKRGDVTVSYRGLKWGRKCLPKQTIDKVILLSSEGKSIRQICALVKVFNESKGHGRNISIGSVQKIIQENLR